MSAKFTKSTYNLLVKCLNAQSKRVNDALILDTAQRKIAESKITTAKAEIEAIGFEAEEDITAEDNA